MDYSGKIIRKTPVVPSQTSASGVWSLDEALQAQRTDTWPVANVPDPISRSLRFRSSASAFLNRTFALGNRKTWTFSAWVKRGILGAQQNILHAYDGSSANRGAIRFNSDDTLAFDTGGAVGSFGATITTAVFRDPSAWYHIVCTLDTTQATGANRQRVWVNGVQQTLTVTATAAQNYDGQINLNISHQISSTNGSTPFLDGYMTEVQFIDGQALTPSSFGGTNAVTGVWEPRQYTGTYGTNGFYLPFSNITNTTTLGNDFSGNGNNWTTNNISLTAGSTYDSMLDVPTQWIGYNTGNVASVTRGNYCVLNPIDTTSGTSITNGNLNVTTATTNFGLTKGTFWVSSGKWYWEITVNGTTSATLNAVIGITNGTETYVGQVGGYSYASSGDKVNNASFSAYGASYTTNDIIGIAYDADGGTITFFKNGVSQGQAFSGISGLFTPAVSDLNVDRGTLYTANFGQRPFAYTPPAGFLSLCTTNLPNPTILQGNRFFDATLYTGNGATPNTISGLNFAPDMVWAKGRSTNDAHVVTDTVRGAGVAVYPNATSAEGGSGLYQFNSNGFLLNADGRLNTNGATYVAWSWNAGGTTVTNTAGSITSQVRANPTAGFSVVTYTGTGSPATVGHGLGVAPRMIIVKRLNSAVNWAVYNANIGNTNFLQLNTTVNSTAQGGNNFWNSTTPTSTVFSVGTVTDTNASGGTYVAYCFAAVPGYSAFGSYTGNGSTDGTFVFTGFRPRFVMYKRTDSTGGWIMYDTARDPSNVVDLIIEAQSSSAESSGSPFADIDFVSNGFKTRGTSSAINSSGGTYIFMAFAENPFKNALAR
jgi:hypothetical protein